VSEENFFLAEKIESVPVHFKDKMYQYILSQNLRTPTHRLMYIYIFRFRSYLVTDIGMLLVAKGELVNFCEAYLTCWANALVNETPRDCTVVIEGVGAR
jgi:hypothetical protein